VNNGSEKSAYSESKAEKTLHIAGVLSKIVLKIAETVVLLLLFTGVFFLIIFSLYVKKAVVPKIDLNLDSFVLKQTSSVLYEDTDGQWKELLALRSEENRVWLSLDEIPEDFVDAVVAIEDRRFYEHNGVDWYRTTGAFFNMFLGMRNDFGGSTITQQLIKNLTEKDDVTVQRKLAEIFQALYLEQKYSKDEILEWYLNVVYFGEGSYGVETAANTYFGKDAKDLDLAECAAIAGITNLPTYYDPYFSRDNNKKRQETILSEMYYQGYITRDEYLDAVLEELNFVRGENDEYVEQINSYYVETVIDDVIKDLATAHEITYAEAQEELYNSGYKIYSCIDMTIQKKVDAIYTNVGDLPKDPNASQQLQSSIVIMNPADGSILALCGGTGEKTVNLGLNRATMSKRPPGSSIKPIAVYGPAIEKGLINQYSVFVDTPGKKLNGTSWYPSNYGGGNYGGITVYNAVRLSLNTISAQVLDKMTPQVSFDFLKNNLGVVSLVDADCDYAPLSLGQLTNGITVREMTQAYGAFANNGVFTYSRTYTKVTDKEGNIILDNSPQTIQAFSENTVTQMDNMLKAVVSSGTGTEAYLNYTIPVGGKTGTTTDEKDRWFCGYTDKYVAAVWTGYDNPATMNFTGNPAAQIWKKVMSSVYNIS